MIAPRFNVIWGRDELVLALYLYCQIPFAKTKANNPEVRQLAELLGRTPSSVARKLGNFGAFDPLLAERGISGLVHTSKADREVWSEFYGRWDLLLRESQALLQVMGAPESRVIEDTAPVVSRPPEGTERKATVMLRIGQTFFRRAVLSSYEYTCCICGLDLPPLLVGSHIVPWSVNKSHRTDPENGLSLCSLHDKAFDKGYVSVAPDLRILVSAIVLDSNSKSAKDMLVKFANHEVRKPRRFAPRRELLEWHMKNVFRS